jgi:peptidoglycan/LPS O-acetylase OafA/YrhL
LPGGYVGVDVFFVISGYLISGMLLSDLDRRRFSFLEFYARRFRRILPPVMLVIAATLLCGSVCLLPSDFRELSKEAWASAVYGINFLLWHDSGYFDASATTKPLLHLWSLAVEEQFYLVWPAFLLAANWCRRRTDLGIIAILIVSLLVCVITTPNDQAAGFYSPISRLWELAAGGLLIHFERHRAHAHPQRTKPAWLRNGLAIVGLVLILGAALLYTSASIFPGYLAVVPVLGAVLILAGGTQAWLNRVVLACPPMVHVGKRSYSVYLWHWPVLVLGDLIFGDGHFSYLKEVCLALSCVLAWGAYSWFESPIRRLPVNAANAWKFLASGVGASVAVASVGFLIASGTLSRASDARLITREYHRAEEGCTFDGPGVRPNTAIFAPCEVVKFPGRPVVVLVGDSHARALYSGLKPYLESKQLNLIEYTATGCGPLMTQDVQPPCAATYEYVLRKIAEERPDLVILCAHYLTWTARLSAGYEDFIVQRLSQLRKAGPRNVLMVGQMPIWDATLPRILNEKYLRVNMAAPDRMFTGLDLDSLKIDESMRRASERLGLPYYSVKEQLCNVRGCLTRVGDRLPEDLIVFDDGHLTLSGARYVLDTGLAQRIDSIIAAVAIP